MFGSATPFLNVAYRSDPARETPKRNTRPGNGSAFRQALQPGAGCSAIRSERQPVAPCRTPDNSPACIQRLAPARCDGKSQTGFPPHEGRVIPHPPAAPFRRDTQCTAVQPSRRASGVISGSRRAAFSHASVIALGRFSVEITYSSMPNAPSSRATSSNASAFGASGLGCMLCGSHVRPKPLSCPSVSSTMALRPVRFGNSSRAVR